MPKSYLLNGQDLDPQFTNTCIFGVMPLPGMVGEIQMFLLGDVFLRNFYSVYDFENLLVYLAVNVHSKDVVGYGDPPTKHGNILVFTVVMMGIVICSFYLTKMITINNHCKMLIRV
jgi:hypothetical protein